MKFKRLRVIAPLLTTVTLASPVMAAEWKYVMEEALTDPQGMYATKFKEEIEKNSNHTIKIYPVGTLGESVDAMEQAQAGLVEFIDQSPGFTGTLIPEAEAFLVPYVQPTDPQVVHRFFKESKAINEMFHESYREQGLELLAIFPEGEMVVTTKKVFHTPEDLAGIKIRTMSSPLLLKTYEAFGASPIALPWGELVGALKTGMVDGQENPTIWIEAYGLDDLAPVLTYTGHGQYTTAVMANADFYDGLSQKDQQLIQDATRVSLNFILDEAVNLDRKGLEKIKETNKNLKIVRLTDKEREAFRQRARQVEQEFIKRAGKRGAEILEQMKKDIAAASQ